VVLVGLLNPTSFVHSSTYAAIFILCVAQSCCIPTSSELTMGVAGALAATGKVNLAAVIAIGTVGEVVGAYIAYWVGRAGGRRVVDRWGKYLLLSHADLDRAEAWYERHDRWGVFGSRLVPLVRNFVAVPAGIAEVPLVRFGVLTGAGSLVWLGAWAGIGYGVGSQWTKIAHDFSDAGYVIGVLVVLAIVFVIWHRYRSYQAATAGGNGPAHVGARTHSEMQETPQARLDAPSGTSAPAASAGPPAPPD